MNRLLASSVVAAVLGLAQLAQAQDVVDPIGSLLDQMDEETAEARGVAPDPTPAPPSAPVALPAPATSQPYSAPRPYAPAPTRPSLSSPVHIDDYGKSPEAPMGPVELGYENRMRSSFNAAQGMQGPLDGAWTLRSRAGQPLYSFLFVDKGAGTLEGAWRDPRRRGAADSSGFMSDVRRIGAQVTVSFYPAPGAGAASVTLTPGAGGEWSGELIDGSGRAAVTMKRD